MIVDYARRVANVIALVLCSVGNSACHGGCLKTDEIRALLNQEIKAGDSRDKVDVVLKNAGIDYSYDANQHRYGSTIRDDRCGPWQAISIYVNFDLSEKVTGVEVFESYTSP